MLTSLGICGKIGNKAWIKPRKTVSKCYTDGADATGN